LMFAKACDVCESVCGLRKRLTFAEVSDFCRSV